MGANGSLERSASESANQVHSGRSGPYLPLPRNEGIHTQWRLQSRRAHAGRGRGNGRGGSLHQPRKARTNQLSHLRLHQQVCKLKIVL